MPDTIQVNDYDFGEAIRLGLILTDPDGVYVDPTTVTFKYRQDTIGSTVYTKVYLTDLTVIRDSPGRYHVDIVPPTSGLWFYRVQTTGPSVPDAAENSFYVNPSRF